MAKNSSPRKETPPTSKRKTIKQKNANLFDVSSERHGNIDGDIKDSHETNQYAEKGQVVEELDISFKTLEKKNSQSSLIVGFDIELPLYIEVHKGNLLQYFASGIIYPSAYSNQSAFTDPQSYSPDFLLISNGQFNNSDEDFVLLHVSTTAIDKSQLHTLLDYALYDGVIPVTRVLKIFSSSLDTKQKILNDSLLRDGGFIPEKLIEVGMPKGLKRATYSESTTEARTNWKDKLNHYDKMLGLIAGSRNYSLLTFNQTLSFKTVSDHSLFAIQAIHNDFANQILNGAAISDFYKWLFNKRCPEDRILLQWIFNRIYENTNFTDLDTNNFEFVCIDTKAFEGEEKSLKNIFSSLRKSLERKKVFADILKLKSKQVLPLYLFAYLRNYGTRTNPELARLDLQHSGATKYSEYAFSILNFFFGYKQLRNSEDRLNITDKKLISLLSESAKPVIKFELMTAFDYKVIDYVFDQVFNADIKPEENRYTQYDHIIEESINPPMKLVGYTFRSASLFGRQYQTLLKTTSSENEDAILTFLNKLPDEISIFSEFGLLCHKSGLKRNLIGLEELISNPKSIFKFVFYSKAELIAAYLANKLDEEEIRQRIHLSQKHKEI